LVGLAPHAAAAAEEPALDARAWVLVDSEDGDVLASRLAGRAYPVASTTKLMTAYVARKALGLDEVVTAPGYVANAAESLLGLTEGERINVRDLLYGLILASGNDAAVALATASSGSVEAFVERMNREAAKLGLRDTNYANPIGLDDPANYSSAADLVELAAELRRDSVFREIFDSPAATLTSGAQTRDIVNRNELVRTVPWVNGVKTGYTIGAGNVLVGSGTRDGITLISAVLGAPSESARDSETLELLEYGFSLYRPERVVANGERLASATVHFQDEALPVVAAEGLKLTVRRDQRVAAEVDAPTEVEGPIERGERLGRVVVEVDGERAGAVPLIAARAVAAATISDKVDSVVPGPAVVAWLLLFFALAAVLVLAVWFWGRTRWAR
jgi:D-alanyl-D-alanine carboxypeptidase (penicillin-binding protein 5/6)